MKKKLFLLIPIMFLLMSGLALLFTGPDQNSGYPTREHSPYLLPWEAGKEHWCTQGNISLFTHRNFYEFSYDFYMVKSSKVIASRSGTVVKVVDHVQEIGWFEGNSITILHDDSTQAVYAHLDYKGSRVKMGDSVTQGQHIGFSGMTGKTLYPHLHFQVLNSEGTKSVPVSFKDVPGGIPLTFTKYKSENISR